MNSDPHDSAAWRIFGMLDADESAIFDEAMRHDLVLRRAHVEMDRLSAAISAASVAAVKPRAGQFLRLQNRLGLNPVRRVHIWIGVSGWAAAAVLALLLVFTRGEVTRIGAGSVARSPETKPPMPPEMAQQSASVVPSDGRAAISQANKKAAAEQLEQNKATAEAIVAAEDIAKANVKVETKHLVQEIEVLRENLEKIQQRDRLFFEAIPGVAIPIVMTMQPPHLDSEGAVILAQNDSSTSIIGILGDSLKVTRSDDGKNAVAALSEDGIAIAGPLTAVRSAPLSPAMPSAIPIYDAARDSGTLVVNNLRPAGEGRVYNLWVNTQEGKTPIYVGSLPETTATSGDSFDFTLGSTHVLPSGFVLTEDELNKPTTPSGTNTILRGPPPPSE